MQPCSDTMKNIYESERQRREKERREKGEDTKRAHGHLRESPNTRIEMFHRTSNVRRQINV